MPASLTAGTPLPRLLAAAALPPIFVKQPDRQGAELQEAMPWERLDEPFHVLDQGGLLTV
jgi:hypothetical protein